jgi:hypothetical protein
MGKYVGHIDACDEGRTLFYRCLFSWRRLMIQAIEDISLSPGNIAILVRTDKNNSGIRFSLSYTLQPEGYPNTVHDIEMSPMRLRESTRSVVAILVPHREVLLSIDQVMRYFQYVHAHLLLRKNHPLTFKAWARARTP